MNLAIDSPLFVCVCCCLNALFTYLAYFVLPLSHFASCTLPCLVCSPLPIPQFVLPCLPCLWLCLFYLPLVALGTTSFMTQKHSFQYPHPSALVLSTCLKLNKVPSNCMQDCKNTCTLTFVMFHHQYLRCQHTMKRKHRQQSKSQSISKLWTIMKKNP